MHPACFELFAQESVLGQRAATAEDLLRAANFLKLKSRHLRGVTARRLGAIPIPRSFFRLEDRFLPPLSWWRRGGVEPPASLRPLGPVPHPRLRSRLRAMKAALNRYAMAIVPRADEEKRVPPRPAPRPAALGPGEARSGRGCGSQTAADARKRQAWHPEARNPKRPATGLLKELLRRGTCRMS